MRGCRLAQQRAGEEVEDVMRLVQVYLMGHIRRCQPEARRVDVSSEGTFDNVDACLIQGLMSPRSDGGIGDHLARAPGLAQEAINVQVSVSNECDIPA